MAQHRLGIIMNGVTGRMGMNQQLIRSILAIRAQGGVALKNGDRVMPDPILVGRNEARLAQLAKAHGLTRWTSNLNAALKNLSTALGTLRSQASNFGSSLSVVQTRQDFTKATIDTLQTGSDNLVLADTNAEGANLLALQTRQSLSTTSLSLAAQAANSVLRLFG